MGKRKKTADFQKVKLKVGRQLRRGTNVTNTAFQSKKVVIRKQLKGNDDESDIHDKLTLKELLSRVEHPNASTQQGCLKQIKENITRQKEIITINLSEIIEKVIKVIYDLNSIVRKAAIDVLKVILHTIPEVQMKTFSPLIISHLCCAMTHLSNDVRRDSLRLLDIILDTQPKQICDSTMVLKRFLEQISRRSMNYNSKEKTAKTKRLLYVEPNDVVTSQAWRQHVLKGLVKFLNAIIQQLENQGTSDGDAMPEVKWEEDKVLQLSLCEYGGLAPVCIELQSYKSDSSSAENCSKNTGAVKSFVADIMPLLFATWREETRGHLSFIAESLVSASSANIINIVMKVICRLGEWIRLIQNEDESENLVEWFQENFNALFCSEIMDYFPYSQHNVTGKKKGKKTKTDGQTTCVELNLSICSLYSSYITGTTHCIEKQKTAVETYFSRITLMACSDTKIPIPTLLKIARYILDNDAKTVSTYTYLLALSKLNKSLLPSNKWRSMITSFFAQMILEPRYANLLEVYLSDWLASLIYELQIMEDSEIVDKKLLNVIQKLCARRHPAFMKSLQKNCQALLELLPTEDEILQNTVADLITNVCDISTEYLQELANAIRDPRVSLRNIRYIVQHLSDRVLTSNSPGLTLHDLVKFLFNLATGIVINEENKWSDHDVGDFSIAWQSAAHLLMYTIFPSKIWKRHSKIIEIAVQSLLWFPNKENTSMCTFYFLRQFLASCSSMPIHCVLGLFSLRDKVACHYGYKCQDKELTLWLAELTLSSLVYGIVLMSVVQDEEDQKCCGVSDLFNSLIPNRSAALDIVNLIKAKISLVQDLTSGYYIGTILMFLMQQNYIKPNDLNILSPILEALKANLGDKCMNQQWWLNIYNFFSV